MKYLKEKWINILLSGVALSLIMVIAFEHNGLNTLAGISSAIGVVFVSLLILRVGYFLFTALTRTNKKSSQKKEVTFSMIPWNLASALFFTAFTLMFILTDATALKWIWIGLAAICLWQMVEGSFKSEKQYSEEL